MSEENSNKNLTITTDTSQQDPQQRIHSSASSFVVPPPTAPINIPGSSADSSIHNQHHPSGPLPPWVAGASPAKFFTIDEILKVNSTLEKMLLAHEIAIDPEFSLEKLPKDPLEEHVKKCMHNAFWEKLREDFAAQPPIYEHAFTLIIDLKEMILGLLTESQVNVRQLVESGLDPALIKQQIQNNAFDLKTLLTFVMDVLSKLCAPARDEAMEKLKQETDIITTFRGIFEFVEMMKLDMANFTVSKNRSTIETYAAEYEREQFLKVLEVDPQGNTALQICLHKILADYFASHPEIQSQTELSNTQVKELIAQFYMFLFDSPPSIQEFPETLKMDELRIRALSEKYLQLILVISTIFVSGNIIGKEICETKNFKNLVKKDLIILLNDVTENNLAERLESVALQVVKLSKEICGEDKWSNEQEDALKKQINELKNAENSIRKLARDRIYTFIHSVIISAGAGSIKLPPGLSVISQEICALTARFLHLTSHNWRAFGIYYGELLENHFKESLKSS
uniref:T-complex 11 n=1 Tax=Panagrolaimus sp. ES5 TaxID=591445 RepID=A0AC34F1Y8_9BILA